MLLRILLIDVLVHGFIIIELTPDFKIFILDSLSSNAVIETIL